MADRALKCPLSEHLVFVLFGEGRDKQGVKANAVRRFLQQAFAAGVDAAKREAIATCRLADDLSDAAFHIDHIDPTTVEGYP